MSGALCGGNHATPATPEPGLALCDGCLRALRRNLADLLTLWELLDEMLLPGSGSANSRGKPGSRPPLNIDVADLTDRRGTVQNSVGGWARIVAEERQLVSPDTMPAAIRLLSGHSEWLAAQPWAAEACDEIGAATRSVRWACRDLPEPPIACCQQPDDDGQPCLGPLRIDTQGLRCGRCRDLWTWADLHHLGRVTPIDMWASVTSVAVMLDIPERTVRHWTVTGRLRKNSLGQVRHADVYAIRNTPSANS